MSGVDLLRCKWVQWGDVVHLHLVYPMLDYPSFFKKIDKPVVWTLHDENFFLGMAHYTDRQLPDHPLEKHYAEVKAKALEHCKRLGVVLLSEYMMRKFGDSKLLRGRETRVINNAIDIDAYQPIPRATARRRFGLRPDDIVFAFTAHNLTDERKGLDKLCKAIADLRNPKIRILAIGNNPQGAAWPGVVEAGFMSTPTEMSMALSAADYFAMPSRQEAFALSPMEALACGLPVVGFPVSGTSELIDDANGVVCDGFTTESLKRGIATMMGRRYDAGQIRHDLVRRFSPRVMVGKYVKLYEDLLAPTAEPGELGKV